MKKMVVIALIVNSLMAMAQTNKSTTEPLIIRGKLSNSPERKFNTPAKIW